MTVTQKQLNAAVEKEIISKDQAQALYHFLANQPDTVAKFTFTHVLYYLGGLIAIGAMTLFMNLGWESFGGAGIVFISLLYGGIGLSFTNRFDRKQLYIPAGICATFVVCLTPLAIYGLQHWLGVWPDDTHYQAYHHRVKLHWLYMELGTLAVGTIAAWKYKYPFLVLPIAVTLWYMTMDLAEMFVIGGYTWELRALVSMYTGLPMIGLAFWVDVRSARTEDYPFWLYLFGVLAFWCGLSMQDSASEWSKFVYCCVNLLMIAIGVLLVRRIFVVCGALGCCGYLGYLASSVFADSWLFPVALTAIGLGIIYLGVVWQKHEQKITLASRQMLPGPVRALLEKQH